MIYTLHREVDPAPTTGAFAFGRAVESPAFQSRVLGINSAWIISGDFHGSTLCLGPATPRVCYICYQARKAVLCDRVATKQPAIGRSSPLSDRARERVSDTRALRALKETLFHTEEMRANQNGPNIYLRMYEFVPQRCLCPLTWCHSRDLQCSKRLQIQDECCMRTDPFDTHKTLHF